MIQNVNVVAAGGGVAGLLATLQETHQIFSRFPIFGFVLLGMLGGFIGWALLIEIGKLDNKTTPESFKVLARRIALGACFGLCVGVWWLSTEIEAKGHIMLLGCAISIAPVEFTRAGINIVLDVLRSKFAKVKEKDDV